MPSLPAEIVATLGRQARSENFPVALAILPPRVRRELKALYGYARLVDDLGDRARGDRLALLQRVEDDVRQMYATGQPRLNSLAPLVPVIARHDLPPEPFLALIEANRVDQHTSRYATWADLRAYCVLSADPVGRLVLGIFDCATEPRVALSDDVCTALQLLEHLQDLGEDLRDRDRAYIPAETLLAYGATVADLRAAVTAPALRAAVAAEVRRARGLLDSGPALVRSLHGWARVAVAGFVAGGLATAAAIEDADHDVLSALRRPAKRVTATTAWHLWRRA